MKIALQKEKESASTAVAAKENSGNVHILLMGKIARNFPIFRSFAKFILLTKKIRMNLAKKIADFIGKNRFMLEKILNKKTLLGAIILVALVFRLNGLDYELFNAPVSLFENEMTPINTALRMLNGQIFNIGIEGNIYQPVLIYLNMTLYAITLSFSLLLGIFHSISEIERYFILDRSVLILLSRILTAFIGTASVYCLYRAVRKMFGSTTAIVASFLFSIELIHITISHLATPWTPMMFFLILSLESSIDIFRGGSRKSYILAPIFALLSYGSHPFGGISIVLPLAAHIFKQKKIISKESFLHKFFILSIVIFVFGAVLLFIVHPAPIKNALIEGNAFGETGFGYYYEHYYDFFFYSFKSVFDYHPLIFILSAMAVIMLAIRKKFREILFISALPVLFYIYIGPLTFAFQVKYSVVFMPFFILLASHAIKEIAESLKFKVLSEKIILIIITAAVAVPSFYIAVKWSLVIRQKNTYELAKQWIYENFPADSKILINGKFFLNPNNEYLVFKKENFGSDSLTQRESYIFNDFPKEYLQNSYFPLETGQIKAADIDYILKKYSFDYYIAIDDGANAPVHHSWTKLLKTAQLIKKIEPSYENGVLAENIIVMPMKPFTTLPNINGAYGDAIMIYKIKK